MTGQPTPRDVLARYHRAMLDQSPDALADLYAPGAVHVFPFLAPGFPDRFEGREAVREGYRAAWTGTVRLDEIRDVVVHDAAGPEVVIGEFSAGGTVTADGRPFRISGLLTLRVRDGLIVECRDYMDAMRARQQLAAAAGDTPSRPSPGPAGH